MITFTRYKDPVDHDFSWMVKVPRSLGHGEGDTVSVTRADGSSTEVILRQEVPYVTKKTHEQYARHVIENVKPKPRKPQVGDIWRYAPDDMYPEGRRAIVVATSYHEAMIYSVSLDRDGDFGLLLGFSFGPTPLHLWLDEMEFEGEADPQDLASSVNDVDVSSYRDQVEARVPGISLEDIERGTWSSGTVDEQVAYLDAEGEFD